MTNACHAVAKLEKRADTRKRRGGCSQGPERGEEGPERGEEGPELGEEGPERGEEGPERGEEGPERGEEGPERGEEGPERGEEGPERGEEGPERGEEGPAGSRPPFMALRRVSSAGNNLLARGTGRMGKCRGLCTARKLRGHRQDQKWHDK
ncbi:hypothetical protein AB1E19_018286 [Capra hircus]